LAVLVQGLLEAAGAGVVVRQRRAVVRVRTRSTAAHGLALLLRLRGLLVTVRSGRRAARRRREARGKRQ
jgi:hypothetical protein